MIIVYMKNNHILLKNIIYTIEKSSFICLFIVKKKKDVIKKIILSIYNDNIQI